VSGKQPKITELGNFKSTLPHFKIKLGYKFMSKEKKNISQSS